MEIVDICCKTRLNHPIIGVKRDRVVVFFTLWYRNIQCKKKHLMKVHAYQDDGQCYKCCKLLCIFECINSSLRHSIVLFIFTLWQIVGKLAVAEKWIKDFLLLLLFSAFPLLIWHIFTKRAFITIPKDISFPAAKTNRRKEEKLSLGYEVRQASVTH